MLVTHFNNNCGIWNVRSGFQFRGGDLNVSRNKAIIGGFRSSTIIFVIYVYQLESKREDLLASLRFRSGGMVPGGTG